MLLELLLNDHYALTRGKKPLKSRRKDGRMLLNRKQVLQRLQSVCGGTQRPEPAQGVVPRLKYPGTRARTTQGWIAPSDTNQSQSPTHFLTLRKRFRAVNDSTLCRMRNCILMSGIARAVFNTCPCRYCGANG